MKKIILTLSLVSLFSCASQTPYSPAANARGYGYTDSRITENRYRVNFNGNSRTSSDEVKDMALLRAAEITLLNGYDWFRVTTQDTQQSTQSTPAATTRLSSGQQVYQSCGLLGCTTSVSPAYSGVEVMTRRDVDRYRASIEIVMGKGELDDTSAAYDAAQLRASLIPKLSQ